MHLSDKTRGDLLGIAIAAEIIGGGVAIWWGLSWTAQHWGLSGDAFWWMAGAVVGIWWFAHGVYLSIVKAPDYTCHDEAK